MANAQLDVARCARLVHEGFESYNRQFRRLTARARRRFEQRDWKGQIQDIGERVELYDKWCLKIQLRLRRRSGPETTGANAGVGCATTTGRGSRTCPTPAS